MLFKVVDTLTMEDSWNWTTMFLKFTAEIIADVWPQPTNLQEFLAGLQSNSGLWIDDVRLSVRLSVHLSVRPSVRPSVRQHFG